MALIFYPTVSKGINMAIGALDYLRNRLMNPDADNLTETDDLMAQKAALSANISTDEARQALINDAVKRRTAQINYAQQLTDNLNQQSKDMGLPYAPESSVNVQALSPEQRLQSYIKGSNADPELAFDLENRSVDYLEAKYGSTVANYASQLATQTAANLSRATSILPEEARTGNVLSGLAGGAVRGTRNIIGTVGSLGIMAFNDGEEEANKLRTWNEVLQDQNRETSEWAGSTYGFDEAKNETYRGISEQVKQEAFQRIAAQTGDAKSARKQATDIANQFDSNIKTISKEGMILGLGEQAPQIILAVISGGIGAGITEAGALGVSKVVAEQAIKQLLPKIAMAGSMIGVGIEAGLQDGISAASDATIGVYDYYNQAKQEALNGDSSKLTELFNSEAMQKLKAANPTATEDELIELAANQAKHEAGWKSGLYTGASASIFSPVLGGFSGKLSQGLSARNKFLAHMSAPLVEGGTEYGEELVNIKTPRSAINRALGVEAEDVDAYAHNDAMQAAQIGALAGSGSSIGSVGHAVKAIGTAAFKPIANKINETHTKVTQEAKNQEKQELNQELKDLGVISEINAMGTSESTNPDGTTVPAIDGVLPNKNMSNSNFGQALKSAVEAHSNITGSVDYGEYLQSMAQERLDTIKAIQSATKQGKSQEDIKPLTEKLANLEAQRENLQKALEQDINDVYPNAEKAFVSVEEAKAKASEKIANVKEAFSQGLISEEQANTQIQAAQEEYKSVREQFKVDDAAFQGVMQLANSKIYAMLSDDVTQDELNQPTEKLSLSSYVGSKPTSLSGVLYSAKKIAQSIKTSGSEKDTHGAIHAWLDGLSQFGKEFTAENSKSYLTEIKNSTNDLISALQEKGYSNKTLNALHKAINQNTDNWSGSQAKTFLNKFFVSDKANKMPSLISLLSDINNETKGKQVKALAQLKYFQLSQNRKVQALNALKDTPLKDDGNTFTQPIKDIITGYNEKGSPLYLTNQSGNRASFNTLSGLNKYIGTLKNETNMFNAIIDNAVSKKTKSEITGSDQNFQSQTQSQTQTVNTAPVSSQEAGSTVSGTNTQTASQTQSKSVSAPKNSTSEKQSEPEKKPAEGRSMKELVQDLRNIKTIDDVNALSHEVEQHHGLNKKQERYLKDKLNEKHYELKQQEKADKKAKAETEQKTNPKPTQDELNNQLKEAEEKLNTNSEPVEEQNTEPEKQDTIEETKTNSEPEQEQQETEVLDKNTSDIVVPEQTTEQKSVTKEIQLTVLQDLFKNTKSMSEQTKAQFGVNDKIVRDGLSQKAIDELSAKGFSIDENLVDTHTTQLHESTGSVFELATKLKNEGYTEENVKSFVQALNPEITEDKLSELLNEDNKTQTNLFVETFIDAMKDVIRYLKQGKNRTLEVNTKGHLNSDIETFNGFSNLVQVDENNEITYPEPVIVGMAKAVLGFNIENLNNGHGNAKLLREEFKDKDISIVAKNVVSFATSSNTKQGNKKAVHQNALNENGEKTFATDVTLPVNDASLSLLATPMYSAIEDLGRDMLSGMNLKFKPNTPSNITAALLQSFGTEVMGMLKAKHLVDEYRVITDQDTGSYQTYIGASYNNTFTTHFPKNTLRVMQMLVRAQRGSALQSDANVTKVLENLNKANDLNKGWIVNALSSASIAKSEAAKTVFNDYRKQTGYTVTTDTKGNKANLDQIRDKLKIKPNALVNALQAFNNVPYKLDKTFGNLFKYNQEFIKKAAGFVTIDKNKNTDIITESLEARNAMIERSLGTIANLISEAESINKDDISTANFFIDHFTTETQRLAQVMQNNPQANKMVREFLRVHSSSFDAIQDLFTEHGQTLDLDFSDVQGLVRPVEAKFRLPDVPEIGSRDVNFLVQQVQSLGKRAYKGRKLGQDAQQAYQVQAGLTLALAQGLGIKIEKLRSENILNQLEQVFAENPWIDQLADELWEANLNPEYKINPELADKLAEFSGYSMGSMRTLSAIEAYARYKHQPVKNGNRVNYFEFNTYLEADGIGNGMSNLVRQFTVGFTPKYFKTLNAVGITTLNRMYDIMKGKGKKLTDLANEDPDTISNEILEGSAGQFDPEEAAKIDDVYEAVAKYISNTIKQQLGDMSAFGTLDENVTVQDILDFKPKVEERIKELKDLIRNAGKSDVSNLEEELILRQDQHKVLNALNTLVQINTLGVLGVTSTDVNSLQDILDMKFNDLSSMDNNSLNLSIKRNLAKLGVTPAMYGGQLNGINNQVMSDIVSSVQNKINELIGQDKSKTEPAIKVLNSWFKSVGLGLEIKSTDLEHLNAISGKLFNNRKSVGSQLRNGISQFIFDGVQDVYGESLSHANNLIALDTPATRAFTFEVINRYKAAQEQRNKRLGYSDTDPRRNDALTKKELQSLMKDLETIPVVSTAFSQGSITIDDILNEGHLVAKDTFVSSELGGQTSNNVFEIAGENTNVPQAVSFALNLTQKLKLMSAGGALNFTNTVVSTESMVQVVVNKLLGSLGKALHNVYDGLDADSRLAKLVGVLANKAYDQTHKQTNLQESLFHRFNRANLQEYFEDTSVIDKALSGKETEFTQKDLVALDTIMSMLNTNPETKVSRSYTDNWFNEALLNGSAMVQLDNDVIQKIEQLRDSFNDGFKDIVPSILNYIAKGAATAHAVKAVERQILTYNVNQFAGANRGILVNAKELFKKEGIAKRYEDYVNRNQDKSWTSEEMMSNFLANDAEVQAVYQKAFNQKLNELLVNHSENTSEIKHGSSLKDTLKSLKVNDKTISGKTYKAISDLAGSVLSDDLKIFTDTAEFIEAMQNQGYNTDFALSNNPDGMFVPNIGIYVNQQSQADSTKTLIHETIHAIMNNSLDRYYSNNMKGISKQEQQAIQTLVQNLESNANKLLRAYNTDPVVNELLGSDLNTMDYFANSNTPAALSAAYQKIFGQESSAQEKYNFMQEFLAYSLTEDKLLSRMFYSNKADTSKAKGWDFIRSIFKQIKDTLGKFFFGQDYNSSLVDKSMLFNVLGSMTTLANFKAPNQSNNLNQINYSANTTGSNNPVHEGLLNRISGNIQTIVASNISSSPEAQLLYAENAMSNQFRNNTMFDLRNTGINVTALEESTYNQLAPVFEVIFNGGNSELRTEADKVFSQIIKSIQDNTNPFTAEQFKLIFGTGSNFNLANSMAMIATNQDIQDKLKSLPKAKKNLVSNLVDKLTNVTTFLEASKEIRDFKDKSTVEKIALASSVSQVSNQLNKAWQLDQAQKEYTKWQDRNDILEAVKDHTERMHLPKSFSAAATFLVNEWANTANLNGSEADVDSMVGKALQQFADLSAMRAGRPTLISKLLRLILQAREHTQFIYDARARFAATVERVRERARNIIPVVIKNAFGENVFNEEMDNHLANAAIPTELFHLFDGSNLNQIGEYLTDETKRQDKIDDLTNQLSQLLGSQFKPNDVPKVLNWIMWQSKGLGSLMINRTAKSGHESVSHNILPNSRAIASLKLLPMKHDFRPEAIKERIDTLEPVIRQLVTLHSLQYVDETSRKEVAEYIKDYPEGMTELFNAHNSVYENYASSNKYSLLGTQGYVHSESDPNVDIRIVYPQTKEHTRLLALGYAQITNLKGTGMVVLRTDISPIKRFQTGILGKTESTVFGTSLRTNEALGSFAGQWSGSEDTKQHINALLSSGKKAMLDPNYYENLGSEVSIQPVIDGSGNVKHFSVDLPTKMRNDLISTHEAGIQSIGNLHGRISEEVVTQNINIENIKALNQAYKNSIDKMSYIKIDGKLKPKSDSKADKAFAKSVNEFYWSLPESTRDYIEQHGLYVYRNELDNVIGYHQHSITDIYTGKSTLPEPVQQAAKGLFGVFGLVGIKPIKAVSTIEQGTKEFVSWGKDIILNRSLVVAAQNLISNAIHLVSVGVKPKDVVRYAKEGLVNAQNYERNFTRALELDYKLRNSTLNQEQKMLMEQEYAFLEDSLANNPIAPLSEAGLMTSIAGAAGYERSLEAIADFSLAHKAGNKLGINKYRNKFDKTKAGNIVNNILISKESRTHEIMTKALDYGDLVAKYVLYKHLTENRAFKSERAMNVVREEFVNYSMNRGAGFDYLNSIGATWFASYALGIQKVIYKMLRRNLLSTLATYSAGSALKHIEPTGLLSTVPQQNMFERSWNYTTSPTNMFNALDSHYLDKLFHMMF